MSRSLEVTDQTFEQVVEHSAVPVLVDFWGPHCAPCVRLAPLLDDLAQEYDGRLTFAKLNVADNPRVTSKYMIRGIPTLVLFKEGKPVAQIVGFKPKGALKQHLDSALG